MVGNDSTSPDLCPQPDMEPGGGRFFGGRFQALRALKSGQGVETLLGVDLLTKNEVVIKVVSGEALTLGARMRLEHEAMVLRQIRSDWFAPLLHLGTEDDQLFLVMPRLAGISLDRRLGRGPLSVLETITVGRCLMSALQVIHDHGVLHRDLKPANIIVDEETPLSRATIIDFGLARSACLDASIRDQPVGTARYMSPEQAGLLDHDRDERSDLYSAGVVLFECLAGRVPFQGDTLGEVLRQHMAVRPPDLRSLGVAVPRALDEMVQRLLRKDPRDRYQSAEAVLGDLDLIADALDRGVVEPVLVVGLRDRRRTLTEPAFVGRGDELTILETQLEKTRAGQGAMVILEAESGGGKTRLLAELTQRSARQGAWVLQGQGLDQAAQRPFQVLAGVVAELIAAARLDQGLVRAVQDRLGDQREAVCATIPELAEILGSRTSEVLGPETFGQIRSLKALASLLDALGSVDRPAVVVLDDCQWADELTLKLLGHWQTSRNQVKGPANHALLVIAFRSEEVTASHLLRKLQPAVHLTLPPFDVSAVKQLAESMAGPLPAEAVAVVQHLSEGSPFMATAVLQGMVEAGALVANADGWRVEPLAMADVESSRHAATFLARRIDLLPAEVVEFLSAGAVLGKEFELGFAATLANQLPVQAISALDQARRRHLIWARTQDTHCVFIHDKVRQTLLERLPVAERRELHRRAALYLEEQDTRHAFDLAYHFDAAGQSERALPYALEAAEQARSQHSLEIAEQQHRIAARGATESDPTTRYRIAQGLGDVLMLRGRYDEAAGQFEAARALADGDAVKAQIEGKLGELAFKRGDVKTAGERIERALQLLGRKVPRKPVMFLVLACWEMLVQMAHSLLPRWFLARRPLARAETDLIAIRLYSRLAHLYWFHRGTVPSLWAHLHELNLAERYPPTLELAQAYSEHAPAMSLIPYFRRGIAYAEKSLVIRKAFGDLWGQGQSLHFYGIILYAASRFAECIDKCREAVRLLERTGDKWEVNIARYQIAASLYRLGDLRGALAEAQAMHQSGLDLGDAQASGISLDIWARASLGRVPPDVIHAELERPNEDVQRTAQVLAAEGLRLLTADHSHEAAVVFERAYRLVHGAGVRNAWVSPLLPWLATALRQEVEKMPDRTPGRRRALLRRAQRVARRGLRLARSFRNELPHVLRENALLAAVSGRMGRARRFFDQSLAVAQRQGAGYEQAQTLLARGQVGVEVGWPGASEDLVQGQNALRLLEAAVAESGPTPAHPMERPVTLSLADRFENVLDAGRRIASALSRDAIFNGVREAALRLLRGERCLVLQANDLEGEDITAVSGELQARYSRTMVRRALTSGRTVAFLEGMADDTSESLILAGVRSALCAPIFVRGRAAGCFYVTHRQVVGLFGNDEMRLADFIATLAGAALENAAGFADLRRLNEALELRIVERKQAEKQIQEQAALLDKAQDAISVQDLEDHILFWNRSAERLYGWTAAEALGQKATQLLFRAPFPLWEDAQRKVLKDGEWTGEVPQVTKAGKDITVESRWTLVRDDDGRLKSKLVVNTDITEKKALEAQFLRAQRMESIGTLAGGVAHDINNILTPIVMGVDFLKLDLPSDQRQSILADMSASAQRGAEMVRQILSFARGIEGQRVVLQLKHVIHELEKMLQRTLPKSIQLRTTVAKDLWTISGDATQLYQMLMNLCVNARDAMPQGGVCAMAAANTFLTEKDVRMHLDARAGPYVLLTVTDTGTGIPPELIEKIFDPFFTTKEYGKGTGLGLSTVVGIVKGHGGFINVSSTLGRGTQFAVYLPAVHAAQAQTVDESAAHAPGGQGKLVLIVDDEASIRQMAKLTLEAHGYRILTAKDGKEAVAIYSQHKGKIQVVLTDMMMPGMDGQATIRALHQLDPEVRIIAISGLATSLPADSREAGMRAILAKPYTARKLLQTIHDVLGEAAGPDDPPRHDN